jgi:hypothetical protein
MPFGRILNRFSTDTGVIDKVGSYHWGSSFKDFIKPLPSHFTKTRLIVALLFAYLFVTFVIIFDGRCWL